MQKRIEIGDKVKIGWANDNCSLTGIVDYTPSQAGDVWIIICEDGRPRYFQNFEYIELLESADKQPVSAIVT